MRIGIDLRYVYPDHIHGIGRYSLELTREMVRLAPHHEWVAFVREDFGGRVTQLAPVEEIPCAEKPVSLGTWFRMPKRIRAQQLSIFHALFPILPHGLKDLKTVVTFYDLQALVVRGFGAARNRILGVGAGAFYRLAYRHAYRNATSVLAISEATAGELTARYGPRGISVTHAGLSSFLPCTASDARRVLASTYGISGPFILTVANYRPHKNVKGLVQAYAIYRARARATPLPLVIVGVKDRFFVDVRRFIESLDLGLYVHCIGFVPDSELPLFYRCARVLVNLSLCEGFGLPVLEAMSCGTPVVVAGRLSLPELVGDAGMIVEPTNANAAAAAIENLVHDEVRNRYYAGAGRRRATFFTWRRAAEVTLTAYEALAGSTRMARRLAG